MAHTLINPFSMSNEALLEYAMNPNKNTLTETVGLDKHSLLGVKYEAYNPDVDREKIYEDATRGAKVPTFMEKLDYKAAAFQEQTPDDILIGLNVKEQADAFRRDRDTKNTISSLFNPVTGNTPEERAKNENVNKLLAEIDNFAIQYNLSNSQKEQLKTQVLSSHLGEYIQTKNAIAKQDRDRLEADAMDLARGNNPPGGAQVVRDPVNGLDENGLPIGRDEEEAPAFAGAGEGADEEAKAVEPIEEGGVEEQARMLADAIGRLDGFPKSSISDFFGIVNTKQKIISATNLYRKPKEDLTEKQATKYATQLIVDVYPFFLDALSLKLPLDDVPQIVELNNILNETRKILNRQ